MALRNILLAIACVVCVGTSAAMDNIELLKYARMGDVDCMRRLAKKLYDGIDIKRDRKVAVVWWKKAAEAGDPVSCTILGDLYRDGTVVQKNVDTAYAYYVTARRLGSKKAEARIAKLPPKYWESYCRSIGRGTQQEATGDENDEDSRSGSGAKGSDAIQELRKKAEGGDAMAQYDLGMRYYEGNGVPKNRAEAIKWLRRAEAQGNPYAKSYLEEID